MARRTDPDSECALECHFAECLDFGSLYQKLCHAAITFADVNDIADMDAV
jgi:hypothetical protein